MESADGSLVLALSSLRFLSASHILFLPYKAAPLLMKPRRFDRSCAVCSQDPIGISNAGGTKVRINDPGHMTKMAAAALNSKNI